MTEHTSYPQESKRLHFTYRMQLAYDGDVQREYFTLKAIPRNTARQTVRQVEVRVEPATTLSRGTDSFGNLQVYGCAADPHDGFSCVVEGEVEIGQVLFEEKADPAQVPMFRHPHGLNAAGPGLRAYFAGLADQLDGNAYVDAVFLMRRLHRDFPYRKGVTHVRTTAEEAWTAGAGVCQDYAHILVALCQMAGIPARYVTGLIAGEGESHAWVEVLYREKWIGLDPTNDVLVARQHIKFGHGRDAGDCMVNRGILRGLADQTQTIKVTVTEE